MRLAIGREETKKRLSPAIRQASARSILVNKAPSVWQEQGTVLCCAFPVILTNPAVCRHPVGSEVKASKDDED